MHLVAEMHKNNALQINKKVRKEEKLKLKYIKIEMYIRKYNIY